MINYVRTKAPLKEAILLFLFVNTYSAFGQGNNRIYFNSNDNVTSEAGAEYYITVRSDGNGKKAVINGFYSSGSRKFLGNYEIITKGSVNYEDFNKPEFSQQAVREGEYKEWYENGNLKEQGVYQRGDQIGDYKQWYENGNLKLKITMKGGREDGDVFIYYESGGLKMRYFAKDGFINEEINEWYENGESMHKKPEKTEKIDETGELK